MVLWYPFSKVDLTCQHSSNMTQQWSALICKLDNMYCLAWRTSKMLTFKKVELSDIFLWFSVKFKVFIYLFILILRQIYNGLTSLQVQSNSDQDYSTCTQEVKPSFAQLCQSWECNKTSSFSLDICIYGIVTFELLGYTTWFSLFVLIENSSSFMLQSYTEKVCSSHVHMLLPTVIGSSKSTVEKSHRFQCELKSVS